MVADDSELASETTTPFRQFCRINWTKDQPTTRPLSTKDSTRQKNAYIYASSGSS